MITRGTWFSPDKQRTIKIKDTFGPTYTVVEWNKQTKNSQEVRVGKEGIDQFVQELKQNKWVQR